MGQREAAGGVAIRCTRESVALGLVTPWLSRTALGRTYVRAPRRLQRGNRHYTFWGRMDSALASTNLAHLAPFLRTLAETGDVMVAKWVKIDGPIDENGAEAVLREIHSAARAELVSEGPALDLTAALWAARQFYRACQMLVCRDVPAADLVTQLSVECPCPRGPATDFSVDLVFCHLPELHAIAQRVAPDDALVARLGEWAQGWPLSSTGIAVVGDPDLAPFAAEPALWRLYLDRVVARHAVDRLRQERVRTSIAADFGAHPELSPSFYLALERAAASAATSSS